MTPIQAYELTLKKIEELKKSGIKVSIRPSESQNDFHIINQCASDPERIPPIKWVHVGLTYKDQGQLIKISDMADYLGLCGIYFDTGGWTGYRDWELDWSFRYTGKENEEQRDARHQMEENIEKISKKIKKKK